MSVKDFLKGNKFALVLTLLILIGGSIAYFAFVGTNSKEMSGSNNEGNSKLDLSGDKLDPAIFNDLKIKVAYTPEGDLKLFANTRDKYLAKIGSAEGYSLPEDNNIIIGYSESMMMKEEKLFSNPGDKIDGLFGLNVTIDGTLKPTGTILDNMHFLSQTAYAELDAEDEKVFIKLTGESVSKVFYTYNVEDDKLQFSLSEGDIANYKTRKIEGIKYYPVLIGDAEAKMMREEKLFSKPGDKINGFFGKDIIIAGIIDKTGTGLDNMHLIPLGNDDLN